MLQKFIEPVLGILVLIEYAGSKSSGETVQCAVSPEPLLPAHTNVGA